MAIIGPSRARFYTANRPPRPPFTVNYDSPQAQGLLLLSAGFGGPAYARDLLHVGVATTSGSVTDGIVPEFAQLVPKYGGASGDRLTFEGTGGLLAGLTQATMFCWVRFLSDNTPNGDEGIFGNWHSTGGSYRLQMARADNVGQSHEFKASFTVGGSLGSVVGSALNTNTLYHLVMVRDAGTVTSYINGVQNASAGGGPTGSWSAEDNFRCGTYFDGTATRSTNALIFHAGLIGRALNAGEVWGLFDPATRWDLYHELGRRTFFLPASGGVAPTGNPWHYYAQL